MKSFFLFLPLLLGACAIDPVSTATLGAGSIVSYNVAGKSPMDVAVSYATGRDCDSLKATERGAYCTEHPLTQNQYFTAANNPNVYCFKTMGGVDCHASADPYGNKANPIYRGKVRGASAAMNAADYAPPAAPVPAPAVLPKAPIPAKPKQEPAKAPAKEPPTNLLPPK